MRGHWADPYVAALEEQMPGVINGLPNGRFDPQGITTREQFSKMVVEAYGLKLASGVFVDFSDNNRWSKKFVDIVASLGIVEGYPDGRFHPQDRLTRAQAAVIIFRTEIKEERKPVSGPVHIPDPMLEYYVRSAIGKKTGDISTANMKELIHLDYYDYSEGLEPVRDLAGLEHAFNLKTINFSFNSENIDDLTPLANLLKLETIDIYVNPNKKIDLSQLKLLSKLKHLALHVPIFVDGPYTNERSVGKIDDLSPLINLKNLEYLSLSDNKIRDLSPISGLTKLQHLILWNNEIKDLTPESIS